MSPTRQEEKTTEDDGSLNSVKSSASLPGKSLFSGKGSDNKKSLIRMLSERSLVRKISQSMEHQELSLSHSVRSVGAFVVPPGEDSNNPLVEDDPLAEDSLGSHSSVVRGPRTSSFRLSQMEQPTTPVPSLHRKELILGKLLGEGGFSKVVALEGIRLMSQEEYQKRTQKQQSKCKMPDHSQGSNSCHDCCHESPPQENDSAELDPNSSLREKLAQQCPPPRRSDSPLAIIQQEASSRSFAVKHLNRKLLRKPKEFQQAALDLAREAQVLSVLDCEHIVKLRAISLGRIGALGSGRFDRFFLVLDRLEDTLDNRIASQSSSEALLVLSQSHFVRAVRGAVQLASALEYLHQRRFVFRDCKPANVGFLKGTDGQEKVQLFDFGLCRPLPASDHSNSTTGSSEEEEEDATYTMSVAGTVRYMSPEMQQGYPYNCKTDVYSFAITLCQMLSLQKPYAEILRMSLFREYVCNLGRRPTIPDTVPKPLQEVLHESWTDCIPDRLSMRQARERLQNILQKLELEERS